MLQRFFILTAFVCSAFWGFSQKSLTRAEYIEKYADLAVKEMHRTGIPASITIAQACLESSNGNSRLTTEGKNHFGIKCHASWSGKSMLFDDDKKNECFRSYPDDIDSYIDHSEFIKNGQRYAFLFTYATSDYKSWAHGLKKAGYATNPDYAALLIRIIEDNELHKYDNVKEYAIAVQGEKSINDNLRTIFEGIAPEPTIGAPMPKDNKSVKTVNGREVYKNNGVLFIVIRENETMFSLSKRFAIPVWKLYKFNDFKAGETLQAGDIVYLEAKKSKAEQPYVCHKVSKGETFYSIGQLYGVKAGKLAKWNKANKDNTIKEGTNIYLRNSSSIIKQAIN